MKKNRWFFIFFGLILLIFFKDLFFMKSAFLSGDSFCQFYPWSKIYSESIKHFTFPYWVKSMGNGFPLMAEGQVGGFYPLNILLFFSLPLKVAYNYSVLLHFIMGGIFMYAYTRKLGADEAGGFLSAVLFCFGSAYAGCFYNIVTLRTLAWFPLVLLLIERYFDRARLRNIVLVGIISGFQLLAGFIQMAVYSVLFYLLYFIYKAAEKKIGIRKSLVSISVFLVTSIVIALPQLILTYQLVGFSNRKGLTAGFALWNSFLPSGILGLVFPHSFSMTGHLYVGILSLLFVISCFCSLKKDVNLRPLMLIFILSLFLAFGAYNPVYSAAVKLTKLYFFRNPSKFLFFGSFSLAALAGIGFTRFFEREGSKSNKSAVSIFLVMLSIAGTLFLTAKFILMIFKTQMIRLGDIYVKSFVYNKLHHRYSMQFYLDKVRSLYESISNSFSFSDKFVILSWFVFILTMLVCLFALRKRLKYIAIGLIIIDIFIFSFYGRGFSGCIKPFSYLEPDNPRILNRITSDTQIYRILPFDLKSKSLPNWSLPNANIIYGIDSAAYYTPLAMKKYMDELSGLELIDDSLGLRNSDESALKGRLDILRPLNVKYVLSHKALNEGFLKEVGAEDGIYLYRLNGSLPRIYFTYSIDALTEKASSADPEIISYKDGFMKARVTADRDGFIVFSEEYFPGWRAFVDKDERRIIMVRGIFQAIAVKRGVHDIMFVYKPRFFSFKR